MTPLELKTDLITRSNSCKATALNLRGMAAKLILEADNIDLIAVKLRARANALKSPSMASALKPLTRVIRHLNGHTSQTLQDYLTLRPNAIFVGTSAALAWGRAGIASLEANGTDVYAYIDPSTQEPYANNLYGAPPPTSTVFSGINAINPDATSSLEYFNRRLDWWLDNYGVTKIMADDPAPYPLIAVADRNIMLRYRDFIFKWLDAAEAKGAKCCLNLCYLGIAFDRASSFTWDARGWWNFGAALPAGHPGIMGLLKRIKQGGHGITLESVHFTHGTGMLADGVQYDPNTGVFSAQTGYQFDRYIQWGTAAVGMLGTASVNALDYVPGRSALEQQHAAADSIARGWGYGFDTWGTGLPQYMV